MIPWSNLARVAAPSNPAYSLDEAKAQLNLLHDDDDDFVTSLIETATALVEGPNGIGLALIAQTWRATLHGSFPSGSIVIPLRPVTAIDSITYRDLDGVIQTVDPTSYDFDADLALATLTPISGWPRAHPTRPLVKITFRAGHGRDPSSVPAPIRHAIALMVSHWWKHREDSSDKPLTTIPLGSAALLARYRVTGLG